MLVKYAESNMQYVRTSYSHRIFLKPMESSSSSEGDNHRLQQIAVTLAKRRQARGQIRAERNSIMLEQMENFQDNRRKQQSLVLYLFQITHPVLISILNASALIGEVNDALTISLSINGAIALGLFVTVLTNLRVVSWKQLFLLYFHLDNVTPVLLASLVAFYELMRFIDPWPWHYYWLVASYPLWMLYFAGNLRVTILRVKWPRWKIVLYKLSVVSGGICSIYVGVHYMYGAYKVTDGYLKTVESTYKNLVLLYVFANVQVYFQVFRRISDFDQTTALQVRYEFKGDDERQKGIVKSLEQKQMQRQDIVEDVYQAFIKKHYEQANLGVQLYAQ